MKRLIFSILFAAALSGCAVVPYDRPYAVYSTAPVYTDHYHSVAPGYVAPAPIYGPPVYVGPPVRFGFGLHYRSGGRDFRGHRRDYGQHRRDGGHRFRGGGGRPKH